MFSSWLATASPTALLFARAAFAAADPPPPPVDPAVARPAAETSETSTPAHFAVITPLGAPLRGPHPFRDDDALTLTGGYAFANQLHGVRAAVGYGHELAGSLWFDLRIDVVDGNASGPPPTDPECASCADIETQSTVLGGLSYRLRADIPVIPYATVSAGPVFLFNRGARGAIGLVMRASVGARYYLHEWLGFGVELGALAGGAAVDEDAGLSNGVAQFDLGLSVEYQF